MSQPPPTTDHTQRKTLIDYEARPQLRATVTVDILASTSTALVQAWTDRGWTELSTFGPQASHVAHFLKSCELRDLLDADMRAELERQVDSDLGELLEFGRNLFTPMPPLGQR